MLSSGVSNTKFLSKGGERMSEIENLLKEGKAIETRLQQIKNRLAILSKSTQIIIDLDKWQIA
jgi:hypothetical protein